MPPSSTVVILIGRPAHGKSTLRRILETLPEVRGGSCSDAILPVAARTLGKSEEYILARKETYRPFLAALGDVLVLEDAAWLAKRVFHGDVGTLTLPGVFVLDGVRRSHELAEFRRHLDSIGVTCRVAWIERQGGPDIRDNTSVTPGDCDVLVFAEHREGLETLPTAEREAIAEAMLASILQGTEAEAGPYSSQPYR